MSHNEPKIKNYERERIILQCVKDNPDLHHNGLIKIIVPEYMAKRTIEKRRNSLVEKESKYEFLCNHLKLYGKISATFGTTY